MTDANSARELAAAEEARKAKAAAARREKLAKAIRVGGQIRPPIRIKEVAPLYPAIAQSARVQGDVVIEATIDEEGKVADARVVKSMPLLDQAALDAVRQWEYQPSLLNGVPTAVVTTVTVKLHRPMAFQLTSDKGGVSIVFAKPSGVGGLAGKVIEGPDLVNGDDDPMDDQGHGTHCAGIAAAF